MVTSILTGCPLYRGSTTAEREGRETYYVLNQERVTVCCGKLMLAFAPEEPVTQTVKKELDRGG